MRYGHRIPVGSGIVTAERIKGAARRVLINKVGIVCPVELAISGFGVDEQIEVAGKKLSEATEQEITAILKADYRVTEAEKAAEAEKYTDPAQNPMIKTGPDY